MDPIKDPGRPQAADSPGPSGVFLLAAWCGLAGGLMEVATRLVCRNLGVSTQLFQMNRHFLWLAPLSNLLLFCGIGLILAVATKVWPRGVRWSSPRGLRSALLPGLIVACPRIYSAALCVLALGLSSRLVDVLEPHAGGLRRRLPEFSWGSRGS